MPLFKATNLVLGARFQLQVRKFSLVPSSPMQSWEEEVRKKKVASSPLVDCQTALHWPSHGCGWCWMVQPTLSKRLEKEGITRWGGSGRVQHIRGFYFVSWVEQKHYSLSNGSEKIKIVKKPESWNNNSLQPRHLWVLTFFWLLFCDALCVCLWRSSKRASEAEKPGKILMKEARKATGKSGCASSLPWELREQFPAVGMGHGTLNILC